MANNPYLKTLWKDHIVDVVTEDVIQEGTRFTASRMNNIEDGIFDSYDLLLQAQQEIQKLGLQLEMLGRAPVNNGTFFDSLNGSAKLMTYLNTISITKDIVNIGANTVGVSAIPVEFKADMQVTIFDDEKSEDIYIQSVDTVGKVITFKTATTKQYKKGAYISTSSSNKNTKESKLQIGSWGTYSISINEVI